MLLVDEDEVIADSTRILARIEQLSRERGGPSLLPRDARARAEAWLWEDYADRALNGYLVAARWADDRNWPLVREAYFKGAPWFVTNDDRAAAAAEGARAPWSPATCCAPARRRSGTTSAASSTRSRLRAPLEGFWVESDTPTVADVALFGQLHGLRTPLTAAQGRELALRPALTGLARSRRCRDVSGPRRWAVAPG